MVDWTETLGDAGAAADAGPLQARANPLYLQVGQLLVGRIASGMWKPGELIPSEVNLARELGVSQGTVRKAVMALEARHLVLRYRGRGTYVAQHTSRRALFHFFRLFDADGCRPSPTSLVLSHRVLLATAAERRDLALPEGARVHAILRLRRLDGTPAILERVTVARAAMPDLHLPLGHEMPDELYVLYQTRHGITIAQARERLTAVAASATDAKHLGVRPGEPLLQIVRTALDVEGRPVELRCSRCITSRWHYAADLI